MAPTRYQATANNAERHLATQAPTMGRVSKGSAEMTRRHRKPAAGLASKLIAAAISSSATQKHHESNQRRATLPEDLLYPVIAFTLETNLQEFLEGTINHRTYLQQLENMLLLSSHAARQIQRHLSRQRKALHSHQSKLQSQHTQALYDYQFELHRDAPEELKVPAKTEAAQQLSLTKDLILEDAKRTGRCDGLETEERKAEERLHITNEVIEEINWWTTQLNLLVGRWHEPSEKNGWRGFRGPRVGGLGR